LQSNSFEPVQGVLFMFEMAENPASAPETGANNGGSVAAATQPAGESTAQAPSALPFTEGKSGADGGEKATGESTGREGVPEKGVQTAPEGQTGQTQATETKPSPKIVSEAINKAVERFTKRDAKIANILKDAGLPEDFEEAAYHIAAVTKGVPVEQIKAQQTLPDDLKLLGEHDAQRIIESGDIDAEIARLEKKPQAQRSTRDRECYVRLVETRAMNEAAAALESRGVDVEALKKDQEFADFSKNLNPDLSIVKKYDLYKAFKQPAAARVTPPPSVRSTGGTPKKDIYTSEEIDHMSREEIAANLDAVTRSLERMSIGG
jgi:hypothetical protein